MKRFFKIKLEAQVSYSLRAHCFVSEPFNPLAVIEFIMETLGGFVPDVRGLTYLIERGHLYVQGVASEAQQPPDGDCVL